MTRFGLTVLLLTSLAFGQAAHPTSTPELKARDASAVEPANVAPDAAVITIDGLCANPPADKSNTSGCKTVVTRAEFEQLMNAAAPNIQSAARKQLATRYAQILVLSTKAHEQGLDKGPRFDELLKLQRMQVMAQELQRTWQEKAAQISDKDLDDYYHQNTASYEQASLYRLYVPRAKQVEPSKEKLTSAESEKRQKDAEAAMTKEAEDLHARAAAGEDFVKLQEEAYKFAGVKTKPPSTEMDSIRRSGLPPSQAVAFDLKPGEVSAVIPDPSGSVILKMKAKEAAPLDKVKEEIRGTLRQQRLQQETQSMKQYANPTFDDAYFGAPAAPAAPSLLGPGEHSQPGPGGEQPKSSPPSSH